MTTIRILLNIALAFAIWRTYRRPARVVPIDNAVLLAQLEAMEASLTSFEIDCEKSDRQSRKQTHIQKPKQAKTEPIPSPDANTPSAPLCESANPNPNPNPKRKRGITRTPRTIEEYEATRKRLPPSPIYIPNPKVLARFDEIYGSFPQPASSEIRVNLCPSVAENPFRRMPGFLNLCFTPIRIAARCTGAVIAAALRISRIISRFFARTKPSTSIDSQVHRRAA